MILHNDMMGIVLAFGVFCQYNTSLIITIQSYIVNKLDYYLEFIENVS